MSTSEDVSKLGAKELEELVSRIALYPDSLVSHILPAATAPVDVVQAARWLDANGGEAKAEPDPSWNPSVQVLIGFPDVLGMMSDDLPWTDELGGAVVVQQDDVLDAIQAVRAPACELGVCVSTDERIYSIVGDPPTVTIEAADPAYVYVPVYDPETLVDEDTEEDELPVEFARGVAVGAALEDDDVDWDGGYLRHGNYSVYDGTYARPVTPDGVLGPRDATEPRRVSDPRGLRESRDGRETSDRRMTRERRRPDRSRDTDRRRRR